MAEKFRVMMHGMGKMGSAAYDAIMQQEDMEVCSVYDRDASKIEGLDSAVPGPDPTLWALNSDVVVDFTSESGCKGLFEKLEKIINIEKCIVTGTTPLSKRTEEYMNEVTKNRYIVVVKAPNFSVNVNKFLHDMENIAGISEDDCISIHEMHRQEKSSTSGTAREIAKTLCQRFGKIGYMTFYPSLQIFHPDGTEKKTAALENAGKITLGEMAKIYRETYALDNPNWIKISAERFADEPGTHIVRIGNEKSYREYRVRATREDYAAGVVMAIRALPGIAKKGPGIYDFKKDVLQL